MYHLSHQLQASLKEGRDAVDAYAATPQSSRSSAQLDHAIKKCLLLGIVLSMY